MFFYAYDTDCHILGMLGTPLRHIGNAVLPVLFSSQGTAVKNMTSFPQATSCLCRNAGQERGTVIPASSIVIVILSKVDAGCYESYYSLLKENICPCFFVLVLIDETLISKSQSVGTSALRHMPDCNIHCCFLAMYPKENFFNQH